MPYELVAANPMRGSHVLAGGDKRRHDVCIFAAKPKQGSHSFRCYFALADALGDCRNAARGYGIGNRRRLLEKHDLLRQLDHARLLHRRVTILNDKLCKFRRQGFNENSIGFVEADLAVAQPVFSENGAYDFVEHSLDKRFFFNDGNGVDFFDPRHGAIDAIAFSTRAE
jgi:hypothetical protein